MTNTAFNKEEQLLDLCKYFLMNSLQCYALEMCSVKYRVEQVETAVSEYDNIFIEIPVRFVTVI